MADSDTDSSTPSTPTPPGERGECSLVRSRDSTVLRSSTTGDECSYVTVGNLSNSPVDLFIFSSLAQEKMYKLEPEELYSLDLYPGEKLVLSTGSRVIFSNTVAEPYLQLSIYNSNLQTVFCDAHHVDIDSDNADNLLAMEEPGFMGLVRQHGLGNPLGALLVAAGVVLLGAWWRLR